MTVLRPIAFILCLLALLPPSADRAFSQEEPLPLEQQIDALEVRLDEVEQALELSLDDEALAATLEALQQVEEEAIEIANVLAPQTRSLRERLQSLRPDSDVPSEGTDGAESAPPPQREASDKLVAPQTTRLEGDLALAEAHLKRARLVITRSQQLQDIALDAMRSRFASELMHYGASLLLPSTWVAFESQLPMMALQSLDLLNALWNEATNARYGFLAFAALAIVVIFLLATPRGRALASGEYGPAGANVSALGKLLAGMLSLAVTLVFAIAIAWLAAAVLSGPAAETGILDDLLRSLGTGIVLAILGFGLSRIFLAPHRTAYRLVPMADEAALSAARAIGFTYLFLGAAIILRGTIEALNPAEEFRSVTVSVITILSAGAIMYSVRQIVAGLPLRQENESSAWRLAPPTASLISLAAVVVATLGLDALGWFLVRQVAWSSMVLASAILLSRFADEAGRRTARGDELAIARLGRSYGVPPGLVGQGAVLLAGVARVLVFLIALLLLVSTWGVSSGNILVAARNRAAALIADIGITPGAVITAITLVVLALLAVKALTSWLRERYLPQTSLDDGLKDSIATAAGYLGVTAAALVGFGQLGLDLSQIAIVAGALSVGIGFGLQSVVSNFVSGLILLVERPIKAGDWVIAGGYEGTVKQINVRATEIETFDRSSVIIPNSDFISSAVTNRVLGNRLGRVEVTVGVSYNADPEKVRILLDDCARSHPQVLEFPEPIIAFLDFGASSLDFVVYAYLADISGKIRIASDLRYAIFRRLKEEGIEIPFPQRDLHIRSGPQMTVDAFRPQANGQGDGGDAAQQT